MLDFAPHGLSSKIQFQKSLSRGDGDFRSGTRGISLHRERWRTAGGRPLRAGFRVFQERRGRRAHYYTFVCYRPRWPKTRGGGRIPGWNRVLTISGCGGQPGWRRDRLRAENSVPGFPHELRRRLGAHCAARPPANRRELLPKLPNNSSGPPTRGPCRRTTDHVSPKTVNRRPKASEIFGRPTAEGSRRSRKVECPAL